MYSVITHKRFTNVQRHPLCDKTHCVENINVISYRFHFKYNNLDTYFFKITGFHLNHA